jgi:transposase
MVLWVGGDLGRRRLGWVAVWVDGEVCGGGAVPPDREGLSRFADQLLGFASDVVCVIESMTGARLIHDELERHGLEVQIADARKAKLAAELLGGGGAKTDRLDARLLAELGRRELVPEVWLPDVAAREAGEIARFRLRLVWHRSSLKNRIHQTLIRHGVAVPESDLFGASGRRRLAALSLPEPWASNVGCALRVIDHLDGEITAKERLLRQVGADHPCLPLLLSVPGIGWVLGFTIASEIGTIERFATPRKLVGYTGLCPRVDQSGESDRRGPLRKNGPKWLRWALVEAAQHAARHPLCRDRYQPTRRRLGRQRGPRVAQVDLARKLAEAISHMLGTGERFAPAGAAPYLAPSGPCSELRYRSDSNTRPLIRKGRERETSIAPQPRPSRPP